MAEYVKGLIKKKDDLENDIKAWFEVLKSQGNIGMDSPLVDREGFPRNDIDLVQVRNARHNISCLQNDHKDLMKQIERGLEELHAQNSSSETRPAAQPVAMDLDSRLEPFAAVDLVSRESPAEKAGVKIGDLLLQFGSVTKRNFTGLSVIGGVVLHSKGKPINVEIERDNVKVSLSLTPQEWGGRGLLGCNIVPL